MRFLHLVLYSETDPCYPAMRMHTAALYARWASFVDTFYYCWDPNLPAGAVQLSDDNQLLRFGGHQETYLPGILEKTLLAFQWAMDQPTWDYCVRSNVSTVVDFGILQALTLPAYGAAMWNTLRPEWVDVACGLPRGHPYCGLQYAGGCCILMERSTVALLATHADDVDRGVIDDVAIGVLLQAHGVPLKRLQGRCCHIRRQVSLKNLRRFAVMYRNKEAADRVQVVQELCAALTKLIDFKNAIQQKKNPGLKKQLG